MRSVVLVAFVAACVDTPPLEEPVIESSHVSVRELPAQQIPKLDLLLVVDDSVAMAPYRDRIVAQLPAALAKMLAGFGGWIDLRVGVTGNDGWMHRPAGVDEFFLAHTYNFDYTRTANFAGPLIDEVTSLIDLGAQHAGPSQLLEAMRHALETNSQFWRDDAQLMIVLVSATDDASPLAPADYIQWTRALVGQEWRRSVDIAAIYPDASPRLDEYSSSESLRLAGISVRVVALEAADYLDTFYGFGVWVASGVPCLEGVPMSTGSGYVCAMHVSVNDELRFVPQCEASTLVERATASELSIAPRSPCWFLRENRHDCTVPAAGHLELRFSGYNFIARPAYRFECQTR